MCAARSRFHHVFLSAHSAHYMSHAQFPGCLADTAVVVVETARNIVNLKEYQQVQAPCFPLSSPCLRGAPASDTHSHPRPLSVQRPAASFL